MLKPVLHTVLRSAPALGALLPRRWAALAHMQRILARRPVGLNLETHSRCNALCAFCPRRKIPQRGSPMPMATFEKICRDYSALGGGYMGFSPVMADPLLDPMLLERVEHVRRTHPEIKLHLFTNLIALPGLGDDELRTMLQSLRILNVSVGGLNRDDYRTLLGVDRFDAVWSSLERVSRLAPATCKLQLHVRTQHPREAIQGAPELAELRALGWKCDDIINSFTGWGGRITEADLPAGATLMPEVKGRRRTPCLIPMTYLAIFPDGKVVGCSCVDAERELEVGDVTRQSLQEIWRSEAARAAQRASQAASPDSLCGKCSYYMRGDRVLSDPRLGSYREGDDLWGSDARDEDAASRQPTAG
jgi:radical SAM protein with 4Fe4S-binding SPASM domain